MKRLKVNIWTVMLSLVGAFALAACDTGGPPAASSTPTTVPTSAAVATSQPTIPIAPTTNIFATTKPTSPVSFPTRAGTREAVATSQPGDGGWQTFTPADGSFSIDMPGLPSETAQPASGGGTAYVFSASKDSKSYTLAYTDLPDSAKRFTPDQLLDSARDGAATSSGGELVEEKKITLGEYPGRDFTLKVELLNTNIRQRAYLVGSRLYQVVTTGSDSDINSEDAERFFNSFRPAGMEGVSRPTAAPTRASVGRTPTPAAIATSGGGDTGGDWQTITSEEGRFSAELPGDPLRGTQSVPVGDDSMEIKSFSLSTDKESYTMTYSDFPQAALQQGPEALLEGALRGVSAQGTLENQRSITVDGNPGIEGAFDVPGTGYSWYKAVLVEERMYQLIVIAQNKDVSAQDARRFLDSFKLTP